MKFDIKSLCSWAKHFATNFNDDRSIIHYTCNINSTTTRHFDTTKAETNIAIVRQFDPLLL